MELFGLEGGMLLFGAWLAWMWSDSLIGFFFWLFIFGTCFGGATQTDIGQKVIHETKTVIEREFTQPKEEESITEVEEILPEPELPDLPDQPEKLPAADFGGSDFE